jgi:hypothetical protein
VSGLCLGVRLGCCPNNRVRRPSPSVCGGSRGRSSGEEQAVATFGPGQRGQEFIRVGKSLLRTLGRSTMGLQSRSPGPRSCLSPHEQPLLPN